jgi:branched-chain amino acid transport system substrate-binding protein
VKDDLYYSSIRESVNALALAIEKAKSADPVKVAPVLENLRFEDDSGEVYIRADNHQLVQPLYISTLVKSGGKDAKADVEKTGLGFRTDARIEGADTVMATTCKFQKP